MTALLEVAGLRVIFGALAAVDDVSFSVPNGGIMGLIGPNGAGKTTTIDALCGFLPNAVGSIRLDGVALDAKLNLGDGLHPNANGIAVIVARIVPSVEALIARVQARRGG